MGCEQAARHILDAGRARPLVNAGAAPRWACVAIGSNLGDRANWIRSAFEWLGELSDSPIRRSSLWQSAPIDCPPGSAPFLNAAAAFEPRLGETPESLLARLQAFERKAGRQPKRVLNEARPLDLDLIEFRGEARNTPELVLPHPRAHLRRFVLAPLVEVSPGLVLPGFDVTVEKLLSALGDNQPCEVWRPAAALCPPSGP